MEYEKEICSGDSQSYSYAVGDTTSSVSRIISYSLDQTFVFILYDPPFVGPLSNNPGHMIKRQVRKSLRKYWIHWIHWNSIPRIRIKKITYSSLCGQ